MSPITGACAVESPDEFGFLAGSGLWLPGLPRLEASRTKALNNNYEALGAYERIVIMVAPPRSQVRRLLIRDAGN